MKIDRKQLLAVLEAASAGLSKRAIIEQSNCFVFQGGKVHTFNDEVAIRSDFSLDVEGAVQADPLLALLRKMSEDELELEIVEEGLQLKGDSRRATVKMEQDVHLPIEAVEDPGKWKQIPEGVLDALEAAASCCSMDDSHFVLTCVHVGPERIESSDDSQIFHCPMTTGIKTDALLRREAIRTVVSLKVTHWSETENWLHFKDKEGLVVSCRRYSERYPKVDQHLEVDGKAVGFPKDIGDALDKAQIFSSEDPVSNQVTVSLSEGRLRIEGKGPSGWYREQKKIKYNGVPLAFRIDPKLLSEISERSKKCVVGEDKIRVDTGGFTYVSCTSSVED